MLTKTASELLACLEASRCGFISVDSDHKAKWRAMHRLVRDGIAVISGVELKDFSVVKGKILTATLEKV